MSNTTVTWTNVSGDFGNALNWAGGALPTSNDDVVINTTNVQTVTFSGSDNFTLNSLTVGDDNFNITGGTLDIVTKASFAGEFQLTGGSLTINNGATFKDGYYQNGGTLVGTGAIAISGSNAQTGGQTAEFLGGNTEGALQFTNNGTTTVANYTFGGSTQFANDSILNETGNITLGDTSAINATISNAVNATFDIGGDFGIINGSPSANFVNAGTLEKTSGTQTGDIAVSIVSTGTIDAASGTLAFSGPASSFGGKIKGAGTFKISGGDATILSGAAISVAGFVISGSTMVTLDESLTYGGSFSLANGGTLDLNGHNVKLSGATALSGTIDGSGTFTTNVGSSLQGVNLSGLTLGGTVLWKNAGEVSQSSTTTIGDSSDLPAEIINEAGGIFTLVNDSGINIGTSSGSEFVNDGTLTISNSDGGTSAINAAITSTGTVTVAGGTAEFNGTGDVFGGTIKGAGTVQFGGGTDTILRGTAVTVGGLTISGSSVVMLDENLAYGGAVKLNGGSLDLNGVTLTLSGSTSLTGTIDGNGTLITNDSPTLGGFTLGGTTTWQSNGTVRQTEATTIGDGSGNIADIVNEAHGVYDIENDSAINLGSSLASKFINDGTLEITAQSGTSVINTAGTSIGTINVASGTADFDGTGNILGGKIEGAKGTLLLGGGTDTISSGTAVTVGTLKINGATTVTLDENLVYAGAFSLNGGSAVVDLQGTALTLNGSTASTLSGTLDGSGTLITNGNSILSGFTLGGKTTWENNGTVTQNATTIIGDSTGNPAEIINEAKTTYIIANDSGIDLGASLASKFVNDGTLEITAESGTTEINAPFISTGIINVVTGTAQFSGTGNVLGGTIEGEGTLDLAAGTDTISSHTAVVVNKLTIGGGTDVTLDESLTYGGTFSLSGGASTLDLNGNKLTLRNGEAASLSGTVDGGGTLITNGSTSLSGLSLGGTTKWHNGGAVTQYGTTTIGDSSSGHAAEIVNEAHGTYSIVDDSGINIGSSLLSQFVNEGVLDINAKTGTSTINAAVTSTGTINVVTGTAQFDGTNDVLGGMIEGAGTVELSNGKVTISKGAAVTVNALTISGRTAVTLDANLAYAGAFSLSGGSSSINLQSYNLSLTGSSSLSGTIDGKGSLITSGGVLLSGLTLGGSVTWRDNATVKQSSTTTIGDSSGNAAEIVNEAHGVYNVVNDSGINIGTALASQFINNGLVVVTAGSGTSTINADFSSTGTVDIASGTAAFDGIRDSFGGTIKGAGTFQLAGGTAIIAKGAKLAVSNLLIDASASLKLAENLTYAGTFTIENSNSTASLNLNAETLTLTGPATIDGGSIGGGGTLITKGTTNLEGVTFGGTVTWDNDGRVYENTNFNLGQSGTVTTTIVNEAGALFDLIADVGIGGGNDNAGEFYNKGTLEKTGSIGVSTISVGIDNTGTVYADSGTLDITGAITGTGKLKVGSVGNVTQDVLEIGGAVSSGQEVTFSGSNSQLQLSDTSAFAAKIAGFGAGDSIDLTDFGYAASEKVSFKENAGKTAGELVITDGTQSFSVELFGQYIAADFKLAADGSGSAITYVPPGSHSTTPHLAATHS
jgi:hypothetical protein